MKRQSRERRIGPGAWLLGAILPLAGLTAFFTFSEPVNLTGPWPLGIGMNEVAFFARWLDLRADDSTAVQAERYLFSSAAGSCMMDDPSATGSVHWFEAEGFGDSVRVRRMPSVHGAVVVSFKDEELFRAQREIVLVPATVESMRAKYLELLANELGLLTPEVSFVRVIACGLDQGIHMKMERIDGGFLEKHGLAGASLFSLGHDPHRPDHGHPVFADDTLAGPMLRATLQLAYDDIERGNAAALPYVVDADAAVALLLMEWIGNGAAPFRGGHLFAYEWSRGRAVALYKPEQDDTLSNRDGPVRLDFLTALLRNEAVREEFTERRMKLMEERWRMRERFVAMDRAWLPILTQGGSLAFAQATALRIQDELIGERLDKQDALALLDIECVRSDGDTIPRGLASSMRYWPTADDAAILMRIAERTKARVNGDTLIFPRGRYAIDDDLTVPYGYTVVLEEGARFELGAGRNVVIQGPLQVRGTPRNPVFVRPQDEARPFGTFSVVSDGTARCSIRGLQLSGGSEARVNGVYFSSQFSIHHAAATIMNDCIIGRSHGDDLMNIKGGLVDISHCVFEDGRADLVDLDGCKGRIGDCVLRTTLADARGAGLEVSGARVSVEGCTFSRIGENGIRAGEGSQLLVRGSRFEGNRVALAAVDLSIAYAEGNVFMDNAIVFGAWRRKPIYGGARVMRYANEYVNNAREQEVDELSAIVPQDVLDEKTLKMFPQE